MNLLTIDTSTSTCSVALTADERLLSEQLVASDRPLSSRILNCVDVVLGAAGMTMADVDGIGVAIGPGSFTGLRVGIATAKGLAMGAGKKVVGFSSLAMLAMNLPFASVPVCPMFDARKKEVYAGLYRCTSSPEPLVDDCAAPPAEFVRQLSGPIIFVGEGAVRYRELIVSALGDLALFAPSFAHQPRAAGGAVLARAAFAAGNATPLHLLNPSYLRRSEAELARISQKI